MYDVYVCICVCSYFFAVSIKTVGIYLSARAARGASNTAKHNYRLILIILIITYILLCVLCIAHTLEPAGPSGSV